jgi:hypothetical protein
MGRLGGLLAMLQVRRAVCAVGSVSLNFFAQGAALYAAGDSAAAAEKLSRSGVDTHVESEEFISRRWLGYVLVALNLAATFAYNILCKRTLKNMDLQANPSAQHEKPFRHKTETLFSLMLPPSSTTRLLCRFLCWPQCTSKAATLES